MGQICEIAFHFFPMGCFLKFQNIVLTTSVHTQQTLKCLNSRKSRFPVDFNIATKRNDFWTKQIMYIVRNVRENIVKYGLILFSGWHKFKNFVRYMHVLRALRS